MSMKQVRARFLAIGAIAATLLAAGCGGGSDAPLAAADNPAGAVSAAVSSADAMRLLQTPKAKIEAKIALKNPSSALSQWSLLKTGVVNKAASTVTWSINATQGASGARQLVVTGSVDVRNTGGVGAPIGNVVVRLQSMSGGTWTTLASDVANSTFGDAATSVLAVTGNIATTISETAGSGSLSVPISPQVTVAANSTLPLGFTATFNNDVLNIQPGTTVRAEIVVTFGNAGGGNNPTNVDINGNGAIDLFETRVDGADITLGDKLVPAASNVTTPVTLSDTLADLSTTGTVTYTNAVFNIGATSGTVQLTYNGGVDGGTIGNCAHLTGTGVNLTACDTQTIAPEWQDGDVVTYPQGSWGGNPTATNAAGLLLASYNAVYASTFGMMEIGLSGTAGFSITFSNPNDLLTYLPAPGAYGALANDYSNATTTESGAFGGEVAALRINIDFSDAGLTVGTSGIPFGNLTLCNFAVQPLLNGLTVRQFLGEVNTLLGGGTGNYTLAELAPITSELNSSFAGGTVFPFADDHLVFGNCN